MSRRIAGWATLAALLSLTAAAQAAPEAGQPAPAKRQCFWTNNVNNFAAVDDRAVNIRVGVKDVYHLEFLGRCHDIDWTQKIAIRSRGSSTICTGLDAEIITPSTIGPHRCAVKTVRKLTPEEVAALPSKARP